MVFAIFDLRMVFLMASVGMLCFCLGSCDKNKVSRLEQALHEAKENKDELLRVLARYSSDPGDSLKYRAAVFLIENMPGYRFNDGEYISVYGDYFRALRYSSKGPEDILDSMANAHRHLNKDVQTVKYDIEVIDSAFLCGNIDQAFDAWEKFPWAKNYTFDDFCEHVLPYRIENERLTPWISLFYDRYIHLVDSLKTDNPISVASLLRDSIVNANGRPKFTMKRPPGYPMIDPPAAAFLTGSCDDVAQFAIALFRTFGIAASKEFMPMWGNNNVGHSWTGLMDHRGEYHYTDLFERILFVSEFAPNRSAQKAKVYRKTYSKNWEGLEILRDKVPGTPGLFSEDEYRFVDVTPLYANNLAHLSLREPDLYAVDDFPKIAFLCAISWQEWTPVAWETVKSNKSVQFRNVDAGAPLRIGYYEEDKLKFLSPPFILHKQSRTPVFYAGDAETENITPFSKYEVEREKWLRDRMVGGCFEGSDNILFKNPDTLHIIRKQPYRLFTEAIVDSSKKYRYMRYKGRPGSHCNVAEIVFLSGNDTLSGKVIGKEGAFRDREAYAYTSAMDGLIETSYDHATGGEGWVGLELDTAARVTKILYAPRNHGNYIKPGDEYELFVDERDGWRSLGGMKAGADSLFFENVPKNAFLYLKNHSGGTEERIFVMQEGKQVFK